MVVPDRRVVVGLPTVPLDDDEELDRRPVVGVPYVLLPVRDELELRRSASVLLPLEARGSRVWSPSRGVVRSRPSVRVRESPRAEAGVQVPSWVGREPSERVRVRWRS